jgi:antitoxin PrlF
MNIQRGKMVSGGRLLVPAEFRRTLGLKDGDAVTMEIVDNELHVRSLHDAIAKVQARFKKYAPKDHFVSDELIADRRRESELE